MRFYCHCHINNMLITYNHIRIVSKVIYFIELWYQLILFLDMKRFFELWNRFAEFVSLSSCFSRFTFCKLSQILDTRYFIVFCMDVSNKKIYKELNKCTSKTKMCLITWHIKIPLSYYYEPQYIINERWIKVARTRQIHEI